MVQPGDVVVARNQGLKGGPAMGGSASLVLFALDAAGLAKSTAFVTDGQLSGLCLKGLTVAEVAPEAATGGPIGKVRDGDIDHASASPTARSTSTCPPTNSPRAPGPGYVTEATGYLAQLPPGRAADEHRRGAAAPHLLNQTSIIAGSIY